MTKNNQCFKKIKMIPTIKNLLHSAFLKNFFGSPQIPPVLNNPTIVYQMGKVGSRSVFKTIQDFIPQGQIYHAHVLHDLDAMEISMRKELANPSNTLGVINQGRELRNKIDADKNTQWSIVTLVRDPIKQTISRFFHGIEEVIPSIKEQHKSHSINTEEIIDFFFDNWPSHPPLSWFDTQFKPVFDIDIYQHQFPWDKGYMVLEKDRFRVLIIRLENLDNCASQAFYDFFKIKNIMLKKENVATNKWYKTIYSDFLNEITFSEEYLANLYDSKFTKHFYSPKEIEVFRQHWVK